MAGDTTGLTAALANSASPCCRIRRRPPSTRRTRQFDQLGLATGHAAQAATEVAKIKHADRADRAGAPKRTRPRTYYFELDQTYYSVTSSTFIGQPARPAGLQEHRRRGHRRGGQRRLPATLRRVHHQVQPRLRLPGRHRLLRPVAKKVAKRPGWSSMAAVKDGRVVGLNDDIASRWGPRIVDLLPTVAAALEQHSRLVTR